MIAKDSQGCRLCGGRISRGNEITNVESMWVHTQCGRQYRGAIEAAERDVDPRTPASDAYRNRVKRRA